MKTIKRKLDWRLHNLMVSQNRIKEKIEEVEKIMELRMYNELSLREIGKKLKMSHQKVDNILKQFGIK